MNYKIAAALALLGAASTASAAPSAGQTYFEQNCASCHTADASMGSRAGPPLFNVVGRKAASAPDYN
jgi:cytochrome c2